MKPLYSRCLADAPGGARHQKAGARKLGGWQAGRGHGGRGCLNKEWFCFFRKGFLKTFFSTGQSLSWIWIGLSFGCHAMA